jgi:hypothetical protein
MTHADATSRPTRIEGLRNRGFRADRPLRELVSAPRLSQPPSLHAQCKSCGATCSEWRRWLGIGATIAAVPGDASRMIITYTGACRTCGGDDIEVSGRG